MLYKQIAILWKGDDDKGEPYYTGDLDLGVFGRVRIAVYIVDNKKAQHEPDATVHVELR
ncbi:hypothetical protein [Candidatus Magnetominusculus dajiuhuensis]|uniref:hypothetical protein n=1 Tax=Candidatus Magnetominusculus dajiuhuensis TaxID=3137712 RepID=UPI003B43879A